VRLVIDPKRRLKMSPGGILAVVLAVVVVLLVSSPVFGGGVWCDGAYERWQIAEDYNGGGCAAITPMWHKVFPWNYGDDEMVCLGLCSDVPMWSPDG